VKSKNYLKFLPKFTHVRRGTISSGFSLLLLLIISVVNFGFANPLPIGGPWEHPEILIYLTILFFVTSAVEYIFFRLVFFRRTLLYSNNSVLEVKFKLFLGLFLGINLITFPITQVLANAIYIYLPLLLWVFVLLIEVMVVVIEAIILKFGLQKLIKSRLSFLFALKGSLGINLVSFLVGIIVFLPMYL